jgi:hypothetical protein
LVDEPEEEQEVQEKVITLDSAFAFVRAAEALDELGHRARESKDFDRQLAVAEMWITLGQSLGQEDDDDEEEPRPFMGFHAGLTEIGEPNEQ